MSFGIEISTLLQTVQHLETLVKARLAERRNGAEAADLLRAQLVRYVVCTCPCHFSESTVHTAEQCCGNARAGKCRTPKQSP
jgi:hypothetical protein